MNANELDSKRSAKINAIRNAALGEAHTRCPTCGHGASAPYRRVSEGKIVEGCIDAFHAEALYGESLRWHTRPAAQKLRQGTLALLER